MSGIYIPGMEMPKYCGECHLIDGETCECSIPGIERTCNPYDGRYKHCPLGPVPDHGDLIERNALFAKVFRDNYVDRVLTASKDELQTALLNMPLVINNMPVIIPADGEET